MNGKQQKVLVFSFSQRDLLRKRFRKQSAQESNLVFAKIKKIMKIVVGYKWMMFQKA